MHVFRSFLYENYMKNNSYFICKRENSVNRFNDDDVTHD